MIGVMWASTQGTQVVGHNFETTNSGPFTSIPTWVAKLSAVEAPAIESNITPF